MRALRTLLLFVALTLTACVKTGAAGGIIPTPTPAPTAAASASRLVTAGLPVLDTVPERPLYTLNVTLDYKNSALATQQRIEFKNPTGAETRELRFNIPPARRGQFELRDVRIFGESKPLSWTLALSNTVLIVTLPGPLPARDAIAIALDFTVKIPLQEATTGIGGDDSSRGPQSLTAGHWYVMLAPWREGAGWDTPEFVPIGDPYTGELADYAANILAPEGIIVAGAGDETREGRLWRYRLPAARVFAFAASDVFRVDTSNVNGVQFSLYTYPAHQKYAEDVLITAERAVKLYGELYGPYAYKTLRLVETGRAQGQEYSGLVGIGQALFQGYSGNGSRHDLIATTAHGVSHQWWFQAVGNDQTRTPWLDESFARMSEYRFYQRYYPADADWWMKYFITYSDVKGAIDLPITAFSDSRAYIDSVYRRGFVFLNEVRRTVGDASFDAAMRDYYARTVNRSASQDAFFDALAARSAQNIGPLVKAYFGGAVALPCKISANSVGCRR